MDTSTIQRRRSHELDLGYKPETLREGNYKRSCSILVVKITYTERKFIGMGGGTEAFPDLGEHCQHKDCRQLDFLPFTCDGCEKVFCLDHRSYAAHCCSRSEHKSRTVVVCEICSMSMEITGYDKARAEATMAEHAKSKDCDPRKKKKATCGVGRCKEILTFSNTFTCKTCQIKVCMNHRFPGDHGCKKTERGSLNRNHGAAFLAALASRKAKECLKTAEDGPSAAQSISVN